jgi:hypothetical protein
MVDYKKMATVKTRDVTKNPVTWKFDLCMSKNLNSELKKEENYTCDLSKFLVWIFCCTALIGSIGIEKRCKLIVSYDWMASSRSFSVVCVTCPYWLESPFGLDACMVSGLSQQAEVICSNLPIKIEIFWWLRFGLIWSIQWDFYWDFIDVIYKIPCCYLL